MCKIKLLLEASILFLVSVPASASLITDGSLFRLTNPLIPESYTTIDKWNFSTFGGIVKIDVLSWEGPLNQHSGLPTDANGDGEIAFFDSLIHIFRDDGALDPADFVMSIDDDMGGFSGLGDPYCGPYFPAGFADGSVFHYDSCMETDLGVGNYILAIGAFGAATIKEAIAGVGLNQHGLVDGTQTCISGPGCVLANNPYGDYRLTWSGDLNVTSNPNTSLPSTVPVPATIWLFGIGLIGLIRFSKRRKAA